MERLSFNYIRTGKFAETGKVTVDVDDPMDAKEISKALAAREFASYVANAKDVGQESWDFTPSTETV